MFYYLDKSADSSGGSDSDSGDEKQGTILKILIAYLVIQNILFCIRN